MMRLHLGYPGAGAERELLKGRDRRDLLQDIPAVLSPAQLAGFQNLVPTVLAAEPLLDYLQKLLEHSRSSKEFSNGLSPRSGLALLHSAQSWALLNGRDHVVPEDVQTVLPHVVGHRLVLNDEVGDGSNPQASASNYWIRYPFPEFRPCLCVGVNEMPAVLLY